MADEAKQAAPCPFAAAPARLGGSMASPASILGIDRSISGRVWRWRGGNMDLSAADSIKNMITNVRAKLGPISILQWTAYAGDAGNILEADVAAIHRVLDVAVTGLVIAVQGALPDLKAEKGSVLVTNGGLGYFDPQIDATAVQWNAMGLAIANSAKHKLVGLLEAKLKADGVYVGEVVVLGAVKGTAFDSGNATIEARTVAEKFWELNKHRTQTSVNVQ